MKEPAGKNQPAGKSKAIPLDMPSPWQKYANVVLIPLIIGLTVFLLVRFRMNAAAEQKAAEMGTLSDIRSKLAELRGRDYTRGLSIDQVATVRDSTYSGIGKAIDQLLDTSKDNTIRAEADIAKGDLNWMIANFPTLPGATTRPTLAPPKPTDDLLNTAEAAYSDVIKNYADQTNAVWTAKIGLGAIAENRHNWDEASKQYQSVIDDKTAPMAYTVAAQQRLELIKTSREPLYLAPPAAAVALPADVTATTNPSTQTTTMPSMPAVMPTTMPAMPMTMPSSAPATQPAK